VQQILALIRARDVVVLSRTAIARMFEEVGAPAARRSGNVALSDQERAVLGRLAAGVSREELAQQVLGRPLSPYDRSIDVHISNLRRKLGHQLGDTERIKTVRGAGYIYTQSRESQTERPSGGEG